MVPSSIQLFVYDDIKSEAGAASFEIDGRNNKH